VRKILTRRKDLPLIELPDIRSSLNLKFAGGSGVELFKV
jgi:hypothetical protein